MQVRFCKVIAQQAEAWYDSIPAPTLVFDTDNIDFQSIPRFCTLYIYWAGERVNEAERKEDHK